MVVVFTLTLFLGALLLFVVQPMVGKMILPALGGTPAVWNTCMVFFQAALLAGYAYAHGSLRLLGLRRQLFFHIVLLFIPFVVLPIAVVAGSAPVNSDSPALWLLGRLAIGVSLPFFAVSTTAPLLQYWFSQTGHPTARDPYFLYGASNLGSLLALLAYPVVVERWWELGAQSTYWAIGYGVLVVLIIACAVVLLKRIHSLRSATLSGSAATPAPTTGDDSIEAQAADLSREPLPSAVDSETESLNAVRRLRWVFLAFVPSSLMLGVTTHVTTDIAPVPLLWVIPLALYLLTFVLVFARRPILPHARLVHALPFLVVPVAVMTMRGEHDLGWLPVLLHFAMFFCSAMVCHGELVAARPSTRHLTEFYLWMSVGGVLGGIFNALVAPWVFQTIIEYPLVMVVALLAAKSTPTERGQLVTWVVSIAAALVCGLAAFGFLKLASSDAWRVGAPKVVTIVVPAILVLVVGRKRWRMTLSLAGVLVGCWLGAPTREQPTIYLGRNFFGTKRVTTDQAGHYRMFHHGRTIHGIQDVRRPDIPFAYFHPTGPAGDVFRAFSYSSRARHVAVIGLGAGAMATYAESKDSFTFYEIDPEVACIAGDPRLFSFLEDCADACEVVLGDGRLTIAEASDQQFDMVLLDAFASDAIPVHLLTLEALELYLQKLSSKGMLVFHISNRYFNLAPLLATQARELGLHCLRRADIDVPEVLRANGKFESCYLAMARDKNDFGALAHDSRWKEVTVPEDFVAWTDRYSNVLSVVSFGAAAEDIQDSDNEIGIP